eukprot:CAMPEP_0178658494 /NCGR_PEP_ID=MMETSP0698-20121128/26019_1 /TAXON_ID=265572 /ORGANISM="Extubocellulus spinifer, Strain CCMP396" /LENGTH=187 /DNA_ID=CAMNT_0020300883 /DNA_START=17 /DNA_END=577 /DNA_ORIENTATION=+
MSFTRCVSISVACMCVAGSFDAPANAFTFTLARLPRLPRQQCLHSSEKDTGSSDYELFPERLNLIFDSKCSVCQWEVDNLAYLMSKLPPRHVGEQSLLRFTDLESDDGYDESDPANGGVTYEDGMRSFRAVRPDGSVISGVEVFKEAYAIVDFGWVWGWTKTPWLRKLADWGYKFFASIRTDVTRGA